MPPHGPAFIQHVSVGDLERAVRVNLRRLPGQSTLCRRHFKMIMIMRVEFLILLCGRVVGWRLIELLCSRSIVWLNVDSLSCFPLFLLWPRPLLSATTSTYIAQPSVPLLLTADYT